MASGPDDRFVLRTQTMTQAQAEAAGIDTGLRKYMLGVYNYMALGVAFTGIIAMLVASNVQAMNAIALGPMKWVLFAGILGAGWFAPRVIMGGSAVTAHALFWVYAAMWGALIAPYFYAFTQESIARAFFITAAAFAGTSLYGYTTKKDLSGWGTFLAMASIGAIIAVLLNMFVFQSGMFHTLMSIGIVLLFAAMTAYETQAIKHMYSEADHGEVTSRKSIFGAFMLYGSFVTMFIWILQLVGVARE